MSKILPPVVWTVAGSDSCAGAGLQTDLHTFHDFGVVGNSVITSVTAQHPHGVLCVTAVDTETYRQQFKALLVQGFPNAIKIGLLCNAEQVQILCETIRHIRENASQPLFVVYDPVAVASSGQSLSDSALLPIVKNELYPLIDLITPNGSELALLNQQSEESIDSEQAVLSCAKQLQAQGVKAVLAKGGHFAFQGEEVVDYLIEPTGFSRYKHPRLHSINTHGTGCTFASAIAAMLAKGYDLKDSVTIATAYLQQGLSDEQTQGQTALSSLKHSGYPTDRRYFPLTELGDIAFPALSHAFPATENRLGLYPVVDSLEWIERLLKAGVKTLQIRLKNRPLADVESDIQHAIALGKQYQARLFINDYWQFALKHGAYGVHLGQEDLATADLNALAQAGIRLGVSTHGYFEIMRVLPLKPSYIACGHIFPTQTKTMPSQPQGVANLAHYVELLQGVPTVAIGGIKGHHFAEILATGVGSIAVVTAITQTDDWQQAVKTLTELMP